LYCEVKLVPGCPSGTGLKMIQFIGFFEGSCGADSKNGFWPAKSALSEIIIIKNQVSYRLAIY